MPVVLFVYGGGAGTWRTVLEAVERGHSVIIVKGSGRTAEAIQRWREASIQEARERREASKDSGAKDGGAVRPSLIPSLCTHFARAGIEWRR